MACATFQMLTARTKLAILVVLFFSRYQRSSPDTAYIDFKFAKQASHESVEEWGIRIHQRIPTKCPCSDIEEHWLLTHPQGFEMPAMTQNPHAFLVYN